MRTTERANRAGESSDDAECREARRELYAAEEAHDRLEIAGGLSPGNVREGADNAENAATQQVRRAWNDYRAAVRLRRFK